MGTPLPKVMPGNTCAICWGTGQRFETLDTPLFVILQLRDIEKGPLWYSGLREPEDEDLTLEQKIGFPCIYEWNSVDTYYAVKFEPGGTRFQCITSVVRNYFNGTTSTRCQLEVDGILDLYFKNGTGKILVPGWSY